MAIQNADTWGKSHIGHKRKNNEDRFIIKKLPAFMILAVADGMGGHAGGEKAAQIVINAFLENNFSKDHLERDLLTALEHAQKEIKFQVSINPDLDGMGSTATTAVIYKNKVYWIHIGDSRLYLLHNNQLNQITTDHRFIQDLIDDGTISLEEAKIHPLKNVLDQCVGCDEINPDTGVFYARKNDRLLCCSDGLTLHLSDAQIESILKRNDSVQNIGRQLIRRALEMGGADNVTVILKQF